MTWDKNNQTLDGVKEQKNDTGSIYAVYKKMIEIRKSDKAFRSGTVQNQTVVFDTSKNEGAVVIIYTVKSAQHEYRIYVNASQKEGDVGSNKSTQGKLLYSTNPSFEGGAGLSKIPALTFALYQVK